MHCRVAHPGGLDAARFGEVVEVDETRPSTAARIRAGMLVPVDGRPIDPAKEGESTAPRAAMATLRASHEDRGASIDRLTRDAAETRERFDRAYSELAAHRDELVARLASAEVRVAALESELAATRADLESATAPAAPPATVETPRSGRARREG